MPYSLQIWQGLCSVRTAKSMVFNVIIFGINKLVRQVFYRPLALLRDGITHKNKASFFCQIIEISSCFLFTAIFGIPLWATSFVLEINNET